MNAVLSFVSVVIAAALAIVTTLGIAEIGALAGWGRNVHVNTAILALCLLAVFGFMRRQALRREF